MGNLEKFASVQKLKSVVSYSLIKVFQVHPQSVLLFTKHGLKVKWRQNMIAGPVVSDRWVRPPYIGQKQLAFTEIFSNFTFNQFLTHGP